MAAATGCIRLAHEIGMLMCLKARRHRDKLSMHTQTHTMPPPSSMRCSRADERADQVGVPRQ